LECIDPEASIEADVETLPQDATSTFQEWRLEAQNYISDAPPSRTGRTLSDFVEAWQSRGNGWSTDVALADLVYRLITWIPEMQNDIEGLVHLEAVQRTVTQAALFGTFGSELVFDPRDRDLETRSIRDVYWNVLVPLATGSINIDEELLETVPRDRLNIMSIHQAKGLEFPLVVVDVGSDFRSKHHSQAFKRFPRHGTTATILEDELRDHSPIGTPARASLDRAFDDLIRQYFVAFSRAQDVLLLVGLNSVREGYKLTSGADRKIPNIATGWDRNENWHWESGLNTLIHI
jgi:DNA helicase-2/ATP-dependent DNA helicase PcrA